MRELLTASFPDCGLDEILNGVPHGIALADSRLRIITMNRFLETLTGYSSAAALGIPMEAVLRANFAGRQQGVWGEVLEHGETRVEEGDIIAASRKKVPIRFTLTPLYGQKGTISGVLVVLEDISLQKELDQSRRQGEHPPGILGHSPRMQEIFELLPVLSHTDATLLITGETGTGKDLLAEAVHRASRRAAYPFIKINCGALPEALLESELFGHVRGAFTGAVADKPGLFRLAQGGTLFLTEIGDLAQPLQVKLLTVLDDQEFYPVGSSRKVRLDARLITGTHRDLKQLVKEGKFRQDLYFRLNVLCAHLPPLREREGDVRLLLDHFRQEFAAKLGKRINGFDDEALRLLTGYDYPGNVRELRNTVEYAANICQGASISVNHLPEYLRVGLYDANPAAGTESTVGRGIGPPPVSPAGTWTEIEKQKILKAMVQSEGNRRETAKALGWSRSTLWRKIRQYGLQ